MRAVVLAIALIGGGNDLASNTAVPNDNAAITHALNRLAYGARPGDVERIRGMGLSRWIDEQLSPAQLPERELMARLARLETLRLDAGTIARDYILPARQERRARERMQSTALPSPESAASDAIRKGRLVFAELSEAKLLRAVYSERQLEEVLVDFWFNHFNVFARKGQTEVYIGEYEREVIRPRVLGRFRDLLGATAKSPAMLVYLDNWQSRADGLNENYARELLELHTLGVDGGYTQQDIVNVARVFTGWTISRPAQGGAFRFAPQRHDRQSKTVLGTTLESDGVREGERLLNLLARHPATARHIATKLAQRFVSDDPPGSLVDRAANTFERTDGNLREVVRTIITSPEFFADAARLSKVKTPFEFVASALRVSRADVRHGQAVIRALVEMGMPLYLCQPPTGYDDTAAAWVSSGALVNRINFAVALARGQVRGVTVGDPSNRADALAIGSAAFQRQ